MGQDTVLVIEDNTDMREFLRDSILAPAGYRVLTAANGQEGLEHALNNNPDVILLDLMLPGLSGLDVLKELRERGCRVPAVVLSAYGSEDEILEAFRMGAKDFLQKPFGLDEVKTTIKNALAEEHLRREKENLTRALAQANRRLQFQLSNWVALNDIAQAITSTLEESEVFGRVMANVNRILQVEAGSLLLIDPQSGELTFAVTLEGGSAHLSDFQLEPGQGIAGWVAKTGEPLLVPDVSEDPRFYGEVDQITGFKSHSILCVPLKAKDQVIGVLEVINKRSGPKSPSFTESDLELLTNLASWVAVAVENARLNRSTQELTATKTLRQAVAALAHYINNQLMAFSLELDGLESHEGAPSAEMVDHVLKSARRCIREISAVVKALDRLKEIQTVPYVGTSEMIDIEEALEEQLRRG